MPDAAPLPPPLPIVLVSVTVARRRPGEVLGPDLCQRVWGSCGVRVDDETRAGLPRPRLRTPGSTGLERDGQVDSETVWSIPVPALFSVLELVGRDPTLVAVVWLTLPSQRTSKVAHAVRKARRRPDGLWVARPAVAPYPHAVADALLSLHLATLRHRTTAQWAAIDARRTFGTSAEAAKQLGCSRQNVSNTLTRANVKVTARTRPALTALLHNAIS